MIKMDYEGEFGESINRPSGEHPSATLSEMDLDVLFGRTGEVTVLDVRDEADYAASDKTIEGAARVSPTNHAWMDGMPKNSEYVIFCSSEGCATSRKVGQAMIAKGFTHVHVLTGGVEEWEKAGRPTVAK